MCPTYSVEAAGRHGFSISGSFPLSAEVGLVGGLVGSYNICVFPSFKTFFVINFVGNLC